MLEGKWRKINPNKTQQCCVSQAKLISELKHRKWYIWDAVSPWLGFICLVFFLRVFKIRKCIYIYMYPCYKLVIESYRNQDHLINSCSEGPPWHTSKMNNVDRTLFNEQNYFQITQGITLPYLGNEAQRVRPPFSSWKKLLLRSGSSIIWGAKFPRVRAAGFLRQSL